jgi:hypothetical protein
MNTLVVAGVVAAAVTALAPVARPHTDPGTRSAVVGVAGPVQQLPPGIKPSFDRVTPTQKRGSGLLMSSRSQASTLAAIEHLSQFNSNNTVWVLR